MIIRTHNMELTSKLSADGVESRNFLSFCLPSNAQLEDKGELNEWLECMMFLYEDLKWLLSLEVDKFWNQVIYDQSWLVCLDSFLQHAPRRYDLKNVPDTCKVALSKISRFFLLAIKRMSVHNEDESLQFTPDVFGEIIYESFIFDAAKLLDICGIFYKADDANICPVIEEIMENIFKCQPKYYGDMSHVVNSMIDTLSNIDKRLEVEKDGNQADTSPDGKYINGREAQDMLLFLYDMAKTLKAFADAFPNCSVVFFKSIVISKLAHFSEHSLQLLLNLIEVNRKKFKYISKEIEKCFLGFVLTIIKFGFVKRDQSIPTDEDLGAEFVQAIDAIGQCPRFLAAYYAIGNVDSDFQIIERFELLDNASLEYARNMLGTVVIENDSNEVVKELQDILPGKSLEFINKCIETYGPKVEVIMNNIIEGNIIDENEVLPEEKKAIHVPDKAVLEDKEHVALLKATLLSIDPEDELSYNMYEDEYDDTYDSHNVGANDIDEFEELTSRRKFTIPAALRQLGDVSSESDEEEEGEEEEEEEGEEGEEGEDDDDKEGKQAKQEPTGTSQGRGRGQRGGGNQRGGRGHTRNDRGSRGRGDNKGSRGHGDRGSRGRGGDRGSRGRGDRGSRGRGSSRQQEGDQTQGGDNNANRGTSSTRGRGRGGGRLNQHRRRQGDKKRSQGMMPY